MVGIPHCPLLPLYIYCHDWSSPSSPLTFTIHTGYVFPGYPGRDDDNRAGIWLFFDTYGRRGSNPSSRVLPAATSFGTSEVRCWRWSLMNRIPVSLPCSLANDLNRSLNGKNEAWEMVDCVAVFRSLAYVWCKSGTHLENQR